MLDWISANPFHVQFIPVISSPAAPPELRTFRIFFVIDLEFHRATYLTHVVFRPIASAVDASSEECRWPQPRSVLQHRTFAEEMGLDITGRLTTEVATDRRMGNRCFTHLDVEFVFREPEARFVLLIEDE